MNRKAEWQSLRNSAFLRKYDGDIAGAIEKLQKAIKLTSNTASLSNETATMLNYLADLYLTEDSIDQAEKVIRDALDLSKDLYPVLHADNLLILAEALSRKCEYREAVASAEKAASLYRQWYGDHPDRVAQVEEQVERMKSNLE